MANKNIKRCLTSLVFREAEMKTTMKYFYVLISVAEIKNRDNTERWQRHGATGTLIAGENATWYIHSGRTVRGFLAHQMSSYQMARLGICPHELKFYMHIKTCSQTSSAALFIITANWKQPRCSLGGEWINKLRYLQTM